MAPKTAAELTVKRARKVFVYGNTMSVNRMWNTSALIGTPEFKQGMRDFHAGVWNDKIADRCFRYEWGRQFAAVTGLKTVQTTPTQFAYKKFVAWFEAVVADKAICTRTSERMEDTKKETAAVVPSAGRSVRALRNGALVLLK